MWRRLFKEIANVLAEIKSGEILSVYATFYGLIFIGAAIVIARKNLVAGLAMLAFAIVPILLLTIFTKIIFSRFANDLDGLNGGNQSPNEWNDIIDISPEIKHIREGNKHIHGLIVINNGFDNLSDCFADLERTIWAGVDKNGVWLNGQDSGFRGRLSWFESTMQSRDCKRNIENENAGTPVILAEENKNSEGITLRLCDPNMTLKITWPGELRLLIRIGGVADGRSVRPIFVAVRITNRLQHKDIVLTSTGTSKLKSRKDFDEWNKQWDSTYKNYEKERPKT